MVDHGFQLPGTNGQAVLLIHGLTGTPMEMRALALGLNRAGFTVAAPQLPGHCGTMDDLLATTWQDWFGAVQAAANRLRGEAQCLHVGGLSMGALLALNLAAESPAPVASVASYGATFRHDGWAVPAMSRLSFLLPWLKRLGIGRRSKFAEQPPYGLMDESLRNTLVAAMLHGGDSSVAGLPANPWWALAELHQLSGIVRRRLPMVRVPCLVAHATKDDIASLWNARLVSSRVRGPVQTLLLDNSYHLITIDRQRRELAKVSARFFAQAGALP